MGWGRDEGGGGMNFSTGEEDVGDGGGRRNGREPDGEAWLLEGTRSTWTPAMRKNAWMC